MTQPNEKITEWQKEHLEKLKTQRNAIDKILKEKNYLLTVFETGHEFGVKTNGKPDMTILPNTYYVMCSLEEIPEFIELMKKPFWTHPDISNPKVKNKDIPFEEKKWGINYSVIIEPCSEEMEKDYIKASKKSYRYTSYK